MAASPVLRVRDLHTQIHTRRGLLQAVDGVSLTVNPGEIVGLVGESGSGKTLTALSIMRLLPEGARVTGGEIWLSDKNLLSLDNRQMETARGKDVAMVFQDPASYLNPLMKVGKQVAETFILHHRLSVSQARTAALAMLEQVRIRRPQQVYEQYPFELSGGMRQRILIAMALACRPALVIADEPTTALDVLTQDEILRLLRQVVQEFQTSLLLITHDLGIVADICDRVYVMYAGRIAESADVYELFERPQHPYTEGLQRSILTLTEFKAQIPAIGGFVPDLVQRSPGCRFAPRCPHAAEVCHKADPPLLNLGRDHTAACWLHVKEEPQHAGSA